MSLKIYLQILACLLAFYCFFDLFFSERFQVFFSEWLHFRQIVGKLEESAGVKITGRVQDVVELTGKAYDLNQPEQDNILNYLIQGGDLSLYGLSNAVTRASQDVESYDRATALESIGWQVATMSAKQ